MVALKLGSGMLWRKLPLLVLRAERDVLLALVVSDLEHDRDVRAVARHERCAPVREHELVLARGNQRLDVELLDPGGALGRRRELPSPFIVGLEARADGHQVVARRRVVLVAVLVLGKY